MICFYEKSSFGKWCLVFYSEKPAKTSNSLDVARSPEFVPDASCFNPDGSINFASVEAKYPLSSFISTSEEAFYQREG